MLFPCAVQIYPKLLLLNTETLLDTASQIHELRSSVLHWKDAMEDGEKNQKLRMLYHAQAKGKRTISRASYLLESGKENEVSEAGSAWCTARARHSLRTYGLLELESTLCIYMHGQGYDTQIQLSV